MDVLICELTEEVHSIHDIFPVAKTVKSTHDACVGEAMPVYSQSVGVQSLTRVDFEVCMILSDNSEAIGLHVRLIRYYLFQIG